MAIAMVLATTTVTIIAMATMVVVTVAAAVMAVMLVSAGGVRVMIVAIVKAVFATNQDSRHLNELRLVTS